MNDTKQWTLMFYFASDNPLAPSIVSQLKAIKDAGFHKQVNVIARFDPHTVKTPTHVFDVNIGEKIKSPNECNIGFEPNDPYVRTLVGDKLWSTERDRDKVLIRDRIKENFAEDGFEYDPPQPPGGSVTQNLDDGKGPKDGSNAQVQNQPTGEPNPIESLQTFLQFCASKYPAEHYMLFVLGHGIVVGNDLFLYDEHTNREHALKLKDLGTILRKFVNEDLEVGTFELLSLHSCSMSSLEVAYELADTAKYMLASQGPAFVGSWPYRQILIRIFNDVDDLAAEKTSIEYMAERIFFYCFYNSYDYQLAGYSFDVTLTDLQRVRNQTKHGIKAALERLSQVLVAGLDPQNALTQENGDGNVAAANLARDLITLSHWEAQSYYEENFTDLCDFCFCLYRRCVAAEKAFGDNLPKTVVAIKDECAKVLKALGHEEPFTGNRRAATNNPASLDTVDRASESLKRADESAKIDNKLSPIIRSGFAGPAYQYSYGLSVYFPWSPPQGDDMWDNQYREYDLSQATNGSWRKFLEKYFTATMRNTQANEKHDAGWYVAHLNDNAKLLEDISGLVFNEYGQLKDRPRDTTGRKDTSGDPTGDDCTCPSIKNYPPTTSSVPATRDLLARLKLV